MTTKVLKKSIVKKSVWIGVSALVFLSLIALFCTFTYQIDGAATLEKNDMLAFVTLSFIIGCICTLIASVIPDMFPELIENVKDYRAQKAIEEEEKRKKNERDVVVYILEHVDITNEIAHADCVTYTDNKEAVDALQDMANKTYRQFLGDYGANFSVTNHDNCVDYSAFDGSHKVLLKLKMSIAHIHSLDTNK